MARPYREPFPGPFRRRASHAGPWLGGTTPFPLYLRSSIAGAGFVRFILLFDRVVALQAVAQPPLAKSTQDAKKHRLDSEIPMIGVLNQ